MYFDEFKHQLPDIDPEETDDWIASLDQVVAHEGEAIGLLYAYGTPFDLEITDAG